MPCHLCPAGDAWIIAALAKAIEALMFNLFPARLSNYRATIKTNGARREAEKCVALVERFVKEDPADERLHQELRKAKQASGSIRTTQAAVSVQRDNMHRRSSWW